MRIRLLCVGKPRDPLHGRLHDEYAERLRRLGVRYETEHVAEVRPGRQYADAHVKQREAGALVAKLDPREAVVALDERGEQLSSRGLAERIESWAARRLTLIVGGPLGLAPEVLERADRTWSLSRLTFPHELVRALVAEQLYRAVTIVRGLPYHK